MNKFIFIFFIFMAQISFSKGMSHNEVIEIAQQGIGYFESGMKAFEVNDQYNACLYFEKGLQSFYKIDPKDLSADELKDYNLISQTIKQNRLLFNIYCK